MDEEVEILGRTNVAMGGQGVGADDEVLNSAVVELG